jgi:hypothetical protein
MGIDQTFWLAALEIAASVAAVLYTNKKTRALFEQKAELEIEHIKSSLRDIASKFVPYPEILLDIERGDNDLAIKITGLHEQIKALADKIDSLVGRLDSRGS